MSTYGKNITLTLFGESHGKGVGALVTGLPAGETVDEDAIKSVSYTHLTLPTILLV